MSRRSGDEEACATVTAARLLGFTRGQCLTGPETGRVLVRSVWRADVDLRPWEARFEIADRRIMPAAAVEDALSLSSHPFAAIIRRELAEATMAEVDQPDAAPLAPAPASRTGGLVTGGRLARASSADRSPGHGFCDDEETWRLLRSRP